MRDLSILWNLYLVMDNHAGYGMYLVTYLVIPCKVMQDMASIVSHMLVMSCRIWHVYCYMHVSCHHGNSIYSHVWQ